MASAATLVQGNFVGLTALGTGTLSDFGNGVSVSRRRNHDRRNGLGAGNIIGGHEFDGVVLDQANGNVVQGNKIGTDPTGMVSLGNAVGVLLGFSNAANNQIGGTAPGAGNLISGNYSDGILVEPSLGAGNSIQGNKIGTDVTGELFLANGGNGVKSRLPDSWSAASARMRATVISGNDQNGILIGPSYSALVSPPTTTSSWAT